MITKISELKSPHSLYHKNKKKKRLQELSSILGKIEIPEFTFQIQFKVVVSFCICSEATIVKIVQQPAPRAMWEEFRVCWIVSNFKWRFPATQAHSQNNNDPRDQRIAKEWLALSMTISQHLYG